MTEHHSKPHIIIKKRNQLTLGWFRPWQAVVLATLAITALLIVTHPHDAIISFDEGFHGGAALFATESIRHIMGKHDFITSPMYIYHEFPNGIVLYPPLWTVVAAGLGFVFGPTTAIFRFATSLFYLASLLLCYWFIKRATNREKPAIIATAIVATIPMIMIYSHLMMLEVPLLFGIAAMVIGFYLYVLDILPRRLWVTLLLCLVFFLAPYTKLPAFPVAWTINIGFVLVGSLVFWKSRLYRRFLKPELGLFLVLSLISLVIFTRLEDRYFHMNMVRFFVEQSEAISTTHKSNPLVEILTTVYQHKEFYLRDFLHIPVLSFIWFGSVPAYALARRTPLSLLLLLWTGVTYVAFSGVNPQVPQYIMPIYLPLGIATGLMITEITDRFATTQQKRLGAVLLTLCLVISQILALPKSEGYGWRIKVTGQESTARYLAKHAQFGDRVLTWHDGTTFAVRSINLDKFLPITNASQQACPEAMRDSYEWAIVVADPPPISSIDKTVLTQAPWKEVATHGTHGAILYHNEKANGPTIIEAENFSISKSVDDRTASGGKALVITDLDNQPSFWGCLRILPYGKQIAGFRIKTISIAKDIPDDQAVLLIEFAPYPFGGGSKRTITARELRQSKEYQSFSFPINQTEINDDGEFRLSVYRAVKIYLDSVTLTKESGNN